MQANMEFLLTISISTTQKDRHHIYTNYVTFKTLKTDRKTFKITTIFEIF